MKQETYEPAPTLNTSSSVVELLERIERPEGLLNDLLRKISLQRITLTLALSETGARLFQKRVVDMS